MKCVMISPDSLVLSPELSRSRGSKPFEERLRASIEAVGLAEPIKVAPQPGGTYLVIDGAMRLQAIQGIRQHKPDAFAAIPAYVVDFTHRFELRFQTDIYQDLLPSQLAVLVEHLHQTENVRKVDIARYIGVSPTTVRNYTGLWRLMQRGGFFSQLVQLMDVEVIPSSNPFVWLRLSDWGIEVVLESSFSDGEDPASWIERRLAMARRGHIAPFPVKYVEAATSGLGPLCYREDEEVRALKRNLGLRRALPIKERVVHDTSVAIEHLTVVMLQSEEPVLRVAAKSLVGYLR
jgi:hypothetical protein